jgi:hypothetical protein
VLPHGPLETLDDGLWRVRGDVPGAPGLTLHRVMTIARRGDGRLVVHSAIACDPPTMAAIDALGEVGFVLVPGPTHRIDAPAYATRYPRARVLTPRGARDKVAEVVRVDGTYDAFPPDPVVSVDHVGGMAEAEGAMWVRTPGGLTLVLNDAVFDTDVPEGVGPRLLSKVLGTAPGPRVARVIRWRQVADAAALKASLLKYADTPGLRRLIVAHDHVEEGDAAAAALRTAAATLG